MSDLFGVEGTRLLDGLRLEPGYTARVSSLRELLAVLDTEIARFDWLIAALLAGHPGYRAIQQLSGIGPVFAVFVAEIGDVGRFSTADKLCCWAGLTPRHRESDTRVHRGRITKQGCTLVRWAAVKAVHLPPFPRRSSRRPRRRQGQALRVAYGQP